MKKRTSKRRWLAKARLGQSVPFWIFLEYPDIYERLANIKWSNYSFMGRLVV